MKIFFECFAIIAKTNLKCNCLDDSFVNGLCQPILVVFLSTRPPGYKIFSEPETKQFQKITKAVRDNITFYLEKDDRKEVNFNEETLRFTL